MDSLNYIIPILILYLSVTLTCRFTVPALFSEHVPRPSVLLKSIWVNRVMTLTAFFYTVTLDFSIERVIAFIAFIAFAFNMALAVHSKKSIKKIEKYANGEISAPAKTFD